MYRERYGPRGCIHRRFYPHCILQSRQNRPSCGSLTPKADGTAGEAEHIAGQYGHPVRYDNIPKVGYCHPEVASIGMTEQKAKEAGYEVRVGKYPLSAHGRALTAGAPEGFVKIVADAKYGEVLGVHMIGHNVSELVAEAGIARTLESTLEEIAAHAHAHPSMAEAVMEASFAALGRPIHI